MQRMEDLHQLCGFFCRETCPLRLYFFTVIYLYQRGLVGLCFVFLVIIPLDSVFYSMVPALATAALELGPSHKAHLRSGKGTGALCFLPRDCPTRVQGALSPRSLQGRSCFGLAPCQAWPGRPCALSSLFFLLDSHCVLLPVGGCVQYGWRVGMVVRVTEGIVPVTFLSPWAQKLA